MFSSSTMPLTVPSPQLQRYSHITEPTTILNSEFNNKGTFNRRLLIPRAGRHDLKRQRVDTSERVEESPFFTRELPTSDLDSPQTKQTCDSSDRAVAVRRLKVDLSPCHICRRKPTVKSELDAFANCEACRERTCYICIRECLGFSVEQRAVEDQDSSVLTFSFNGTEDDMDLGGTSTFDCASRDGTLEFGSNLGIHRAWEKSIGTAHRRMICSRCCVEKGSEGEVCCFGCLGTEGPG